MDEEGTKTLMQAAARRSLLESRAVFWMMRKSYQQRDYRAAMAYADTLIRTRPEIPQLGVLEVVRARAGRVWHERQRHAAVGDAHAARDSATKRESHHEDQIRPEARAEGCDGHRRAGGDAPGLRRVLDGNGRRAVAGRTKEQQGRDQSDAAHQGAETARTDVRKPMKGVACFSQPSPGQSIALPNLTDEGLDLLGGRLVPGDAGPAALLMYEDASGNRLSLVVGSEPDTGERPWRISESHGLRAVTWADGGLICSVVADLPADDLRRIAKLAYGQLI